MINFAIIYKDQALPNFAKFYKRALTPGFPEVKFTIHTYGTFLGKTVLEVTQNGNLVTIKNELDASYIYLHSTAEEADYHVNSLREFDTTNKIK